MTDREPVEARDLDIYGAGELAWRASGTRWWQALPKMETAAFLGTVRLDGRPHSAGIGPQWRDGDIFFVSGPGTRKSRNLAANPACTLSIRTPTGDVVLEGTAERVTDPAVPRVAAYYREGGWPARVDGDAFTAPFSAQSAGPPPWHVPVHLPHRGGAQHGGAVRRDPLELRDLIIDFGLRSRRRSGVGKAAGRRRAWGHDRGISPSGAPAGRWTLDHDGHRLVGDGPHRLGPRRAPASTGRAAEAAGFPAATLPYGDEEVVVAFDVRGLLDGQAARCALTRRSAVMTRSPATAGSAGSRWRSRRRRGRGRRGGRRSRGRIRRSTPPGTWRRRRRGCCSRCWGWAHW